MVTTIDMPIPVKGDTWIDQGHVGAHHGQNGSLTLDNGSNKRYGMLFLGIPNLAGATVASAVLSVFLKDTAWDAGMEIRVDLLDKKFAENETWHSYHLKLPSLPGADQAVFTIVGDSDGTQVDIDVTALLVDAAGNDSFPGLLLSCSGSASKSIYSSEAKHKAYHPFITIEYSLQPDAPTNLLPAQYASAQKPRVSWDSVPQLAYFIEVADTDDTPRASSGWITSDIQQVDLNDDAAWTTPWATGLPSSGQSKKWRVKVKDEVGTASEFSPWATWERRSYSALVLTEPDEGDTVLTTTPDFTWTFAGTEKMWQLLVEGTDGVDYDSGRIADVDLAWSLPKGTLLHRGVSYTATLRVWDAYRRDAPGDKDFVEAIAHFTYDGSGAVTIVTGIIATVDSPAVVLEWDRAALPDAFTIFADDEVLIDQVDAAPLEGPSGHFTYRLLRAGAGPVHTVTFDVVAHSDVNGDSLSGTPYSTDSNVAASGPQGVWLVDEEDGIEVEFLGQPEISMKISEDGATYFPLGSKSPIRIVDQIRGFEGSVQGLVSGDDAVADFETLKAIAPGTEVDGLSVLRLIFGRYNIPVDIGEVSISQWPMAEGDNVYTVSFEFWQTGRPWPVTQ